MIDPLNPCNTHDTVMLTNTLGDLLALSIVGFICINLDA